MRKGQMEIIGFMVIILLLFFGLLLYFRFSGDDGGSNFIKEAEDNLEVSNMLTAIRLYTVCEGTQMGDVIKSCIEGGFECDQSACDIVENDVIKIIEIYGWTEDQYAFFIDEELYSLTECKGNTFVDDYTTSNTKVRLVYCYS